MAIGSNNPFPSVLILEGSAPSSPSAGNQRVYIDSADHKLKRKNSGGTVTVIEGGGNPGATLQRLSRTAGSLSMTNGVTTMTEVSSLLRLTIAAATGDVLQVGLSALLQEAAAGDLAVDTATIVAGAIVNQFSAGSRGAGHFGLEAVGYVGGAGVLTYVVQAGDISGGNVIVSPTFVNSGASAATLYATTSYALTYWVLNLKQ